MSRLRTSFAARLLAGSLAIIAVVVAGVSTYLVVAFDRQARSTAVGTVDDRAHVLVQLLDQVTASTASSIVRQLGAQPALAAALRQPDPGTAVRSLLAAAGTLTPQGHSIAVLSTSGAVLQSSLPPGVPPVDARLPSVRRALATPGPAVGVEILGDTGVAGSGLASIDAAMQVPGASGSAPLGVIVDVAPLLTQLRAFGPAVGPAPYHIGLVTLAHPDTVVRLGQSAAAAGRAPEALAAAVRAGRDSANDTWDAALESGGAATAVAGSYLRVLDATGATTGYIGVEAPLSVFPGNTVSQTVTLGLIALLVLALTAIAVVVFVDRFVRRPVTRLERGVARIAGGDYATAIPVVSQDELGRLAGAVNRMRSQIQENIAEIERGRARVDAAVDRLGRVSRALTTTAGGVPALEDAVVRSAATLVGTSSAAIMLRRDGDAMVPTASVGIAGLPVLDQWGIVGELMQGRGARVETAPNGWDAGGLLAVPMFYQDMVVGALAVITAAGTTPFPGDEQSLAVLANNAAIAMENTRLFEQERETVRRLRELDAMKDDFLGTVQHELRTPLTAIMGMSDLLDMCWTAWGDKEKLDAVADIQLASKSLYDIVETIIDFSLMQRDTLGLDAAAVPVREAVDEALESVAARTKGGALPVDVSVDLPEGLALHADRARFLQVMTALVDNAVKFNREGGHVVVRGVRDGDVVKVEVVDDGIGIPEDAVSRVFDRFYQVDNSATRTYGGTGMGLALVSRLAAAHGAAVDVESVLGQGSRFTVRWPATAAAAGGELAAQNGHDRGVETPDPR